MTRIFASFLLLWLIQCHFWSHVYCEQWKESYLYSGQQYLPPGHTFTSPERAFVPPGHTFTSPGHAFVPPGHSFGIPSQPIQSYNSFPNNYPDFGSAGAKYGPLNNNWYIQPELYNFPYVNTADWVCRNTKTGTVTFITNDGETGIDTKKLSNHEKMKNGNGNTNSEEMPNMTDMNKQNSDNEKSKNMQSSNTDIDGTTEASTNEPSVNFGEGKFNVRRLKE